MRIPADGSPVVFPDNMTEDDLLIFLLGVLTGEVTFMKRKGKWYPTLKGKRGSDEYRLKMALVGRELEGISDVYKRMEITKQKLQNPNKKRERDWDLWFSELASRVENKVRIAKERIIEKE